MEVPVIPQSHTHSPVRDVTVSQFEIVCRVALRTSRWRLERWFVYLHVFYVMCSESCIDLCFVSTVGYDLL